MVPLPLCSCSRRCLFESPRPCKIEHESTDTSTIKNFGDLYEMASASVENDMMQLITCSVSSTSDLNVDAEQSSKGNCVKPKQCLPDRAPLGFSVAMEMIPVHEQKNSKTHRLMSVLLVRYTCHSRHQLQSIDERLAADASFDQWKSNEPISCSPFSSFRAHEKPRLALAKPT